jgi:hypothetical protein
MEFIDRITNELIWNMRKIWDVKKEVEKYLYTQAKLHNRKCAFFPLISLYATFKYTATESNARNKQQ